MTNMKSTKKIKILRVLVTMFMCLVLVSAVVDYFFVISRKTRDDYQIRLEETGQQIADGVNRHMQSSISFLQGMAEVFGEYEDIHDPKALECLKRVSKTSDFQRMWLTKASGEAFSSEGVESNAEGRAYLEDGIKGNSGISEIQYSRVNNEKNVVVYAPIYHDDKVVGLVIGIYALEELGDIIDIDCFAGKGYSHIVRESGEIVTLSSHQNVMAEDSDLIEYWDKYGYACPIGINDWYVFITFPKEMIDFDLRFAILATGTLCLKFFIVICALFIDRYRIRNRVLKGLAQMDSMTGLTNRGAIEKMINESLKQSGEMESVLMVFDVDHFKNVNDTMGHMSGDLVLKKLANIMREEFSAIDYLGRLGGDEFAVFMRGVQQETIVQEKGEHLLERVSGIAKELNWDLDIAISVGVAIAPRDGSNFESLYKVADAYLYEAKNKGGNCFCGLERD